MATPSTALITNTKSVISNGPNAATKALAIAQGGPIMDYAGNCNLLLTKLQECEVLIGKIIQDTDATDATNLGLLQNVQASLS